MHRFFWGWLGLLCSAHALAVEVAPRITDREIVEALSGLKAGQAAIHKRIDDLIQSIDQRFDALTRITDERFKAVDKRIDALARIMDERFKAVDKRIDALARIMDERFKAVDERFEAVDKRFDDINRRFTDVNRRIDGLFNLILTLFGALIALIVALFGYIAWDRRTMVKPLQERLARIEDTLIHDLEIHHQEGSKITRLIEALRELAKEDPKVAKVLRQFSLW